MDYRHCHHSKTQIISTSWTSLKNCRAAKVWELLDQILVALWQTLSINAQRKTLFISKIQRNTTVQLYKVKIPPKWHSVDISLLLPHFSMKLKQMFLPLQFLAHLTEFKPHCLQLKCSPITIIRTNSLFELFFYSSWTSIPRISKIINKHEDPHNTFSC